MTSQDSSSNDDTFAFLPKEKTTADVPNRYEYETSSLLDMSAFDKTGFTLTAITIVKSYIGVGCLAIPYGFSICGYQLALFMLSLSALITYFCCWFMTETQKFYGSASVKNFSDLGRKLYGESGFLAVFSVYYLNQYCTCVSYIIFFLGTFKDDFPWVPPKYILARLSIVLVGLAMTLKSMKEIQQL